MDTSNNSQMLDNKFSIDISRIEKKLDDLFEQQILNITEAQQERVSELRVLIKKRACIEHEIVKVNTELRAAYEQSRDILEVVLKGRNDDYAEALKQVEDLKARDSVGESQEL